MQEKSASDASDEFQLTLSRAMMQGSERGRQERVRCEAGAAKETGPHVHITQCRHLYHGPWFPGCFVAFVQPPVAPIALMLAMMLSDVLVRIQSISDLDQRWCNGVLFGAQLTWSLPLAF